MANQYFSIKEQVFDIQFTNRSLVHSLQNRVSRVFNDRLIRVMNDRFETMIPENFLLRFDSVTLDLGEVALNNLEQELEDRLADALLKEFSGKIRLLQENRPTDGAATMEDITSDEALLEHFLVHGLLPWWAASGQGFSMQEVVNRIFSRKPQVLRELILKLGQSESVRKRLVYQFGEKTIQQFVIVLEPSEAEYIFSYHKEVIAIQKTEQLVQAETTVFEKSVWLFILNYLIDDRGSDFNRKSFVKSTLRQMSAGFNIRYHDLLSLFYRAVLLHKTTDKTASSLEVIIGALASEEEDMPLELDRPVIDEDSAALSKDPVQLAEKTELLRYYLLYGSLPAGAVNYEQRELLLFMKQLVEHVPGATKMMLMGISSHPMLAERLYGLFGKEQAKRFLLELYPQATRLAGTFASLVEMFQPRKQWFVSGMAEVRTALDKIILRRILSASDAYGDDGFVFLEKIINELMDEQGVDKKLWVASLHQTVHEEFRQGIIHSKLPELVEQLYQKTQSETGEELTEEERTEAELQGQNELTGIIGRKAIYDTLAYLLQYGYAAWWSRKLLEKDRPEQMLKKLLADSPEHVKRLIRFAGFELVRQNRLLAMAGLHTWFDILTVFPEGRKTQALVKQTLQWITDDIYGNREEAGKTIIQILWNILISQGYTSVSLTGFYSQVVQRIAAYAQVPGLSVARLFARRSMEFTGTENIDLQALQEALGNVISQLSGNAPLQNEEGDVFTDFIRMQFTGHLPEEMVNAIAIKQINKQETGVQKFFEQASDSLRSMVAKEADAVIRHYITWGVLPAGIKVTGKEEERQFIRRLLKLAYLIDAEKLSTLVRMQWHDDIKWIELTSLFSSNKGGLEKKLYHFFDRLRVQTPAPVQLQQETETNRTAMTSVRENFRESITRLIPDGTITTEDDLRAAAREGLSWFFQWNRLPGNWAKTTTASLPSILKQAFFVLYADSPAAARKLLLDNMYTHQARVFFYELFSESAGGFEKEVALFLQPYKEVFLQRSMGPIHLQPLAVQQQEEIQQGTDTGSYAELIRKFLAGYSVAGYTAPQHVTEAVLRLFAMDRKKFEEIFSDMQFTAEARTALYDSLLLVHTYRSAEILKLLEPYREKDMLQLLADGKVVLAENTHEALKKAIQLLLDKSVKDTDLEKLWNRLLVSPSFMRYFEQKEDSVLLGKLLAQQSIGWGTGTVPFLHALHDRFLDAVTGITEKEKLSVLLKQFQLLFFTRKLNIYSAEAYVQALFAFLKQQLHPLPLTVYTGILQHISTHGVASASPVAGIAAVLQSQLVSLVSHIENSVLQKKEWREDALPGEDTDKENSRKRKQEQDIRDELEKQRLEEEERLRREAEKMQKDKNNKIYVRNAGIVLLHPFLNTFFSRLGLLDQGQFIDENAQHRAVLLLHYMAYGRPDAEEYELPLNKVLCGLAVEEVVPVFIEITEDEKAIAEELFQVIFQRWEKMKNTSVGGFRASFVQREGALMRNEESWELRVEQRSYDLILDTLPWSFGMIKTSWMKQILTVEWI